jgi:hypothetical protein
MAGTYGQPDYVPTSGPVDFERLFVGGVEIKPGSGGKQINALKPINIKGEVDALTVAKAYNQLIAELKVAGLMADK